MPKTRTLEPEFWDDTVIDSLPRDERLLAAAMITLLADDEGRFVAEPSVIKKRVFGVDDDLSIAAVEGMLNHLGQVWENLKLYSVKGQRYGFLTNFQEKQGIRYIVRSKLPPPPEDDNAENLNLFSDFPTLLKTSADSPRVGLSRVEKKNLLSDSPSEPDEPAEFVEAVEAYNELATRWEKPKITPKRGEKLARRIRDCEKAMPEGFTWRELLRRVESQSEFFRDRWKAWDLEWFVATTRGEFVHAQRTWALAYAADRSPPVKPPLRRITPALPKPE